MPDYSRRKRGQRPTRNKMLIICEGEKTEPMYFGNYRTPQNNVDVIPIPSSRKDVGSIVEFAKKKLQDLDIKGGDLIWCVFDCDDNTDDKISTAYKNAGKSINICLSNPSFELWFLLHFSYIETSLQNDGLIELLKRQIPEYCKNIDCYQILEPLTDTAIKNSKKLEQLHINNGTEINSTKSNPSTQVYKIIEVIKQFNNVPETK
ncbi:RloB family protein [Methanolobus chelungpuianus]|uniref:RloB family protein n=1 Tax=Methanolobus chelungpuianus TaxID=502115 RepID=UPI002114C134|nr:RloB family protein [Methanolobus chelungpuianus]